MNEKRRRTSDKNRVWSTFFDAEPSVYHAVVIIFLEYFAWGLLTAPVIDVLHETFPRNAFLMNGMIAGLKGILSFLCAPLVGALSDVFGRKPFLLLTVTFTCAPIPLMRVNAYWYFSVLTISGVLAVTFSIVFAYVADVTTERERSRAYGYVSATFAASLVTSPALGAALQRAYSEHFVILVATSVAFADVLFILLCVPESLHAGCDSPGAKRKAAIERERERKAGVRSEPQLIPLTESNCKPSPLQVGRSTISSSGSATALRQSVAGRIAAVNWDRVDPFAALRKVGADQLFVMLCLTTLLSYLPEAGEYSAFFVYLRLVIGFSETHTAYFIAFIGVLSVLAQSLLLDYMMRTAGAKRTIFVGLLFEFTQLCWYAFTSSFVSMWIAGGIAALGSITYPAISAFVSAHAAADEQGVAQGVITGIRGLCSGLGPAIFGFIFYLFQIDLNAADSATGAGAAAAQPLALSARALSRAQANVTVRSLLRPDYGGEVAMADSQHARIALSSQGLSASIMPGPPFAFGAALVLLALLVSTLIPDDPHMVISIQGQRTSYPPTVLEVIDDVERDGERRPNPIVGEVRETRAITISTDATQVNSSTTAVKMPTVAVSSSHSQLATATGQHSISQSQLFTNSVARTVRPNSSATFSVTTASTSTEYAVLSQIDSDD